MITKDRKEAKFELGLPVKESSDSMAPNAGVSIATPRRRILFATEAYVFE